MGWPLQNVETEVNVDSTVQMKEVLPWLVRWARRAGTRDFGPALTMPLVNPVQNNFFFIWPHRPASWAGSRAGSSVS